MRELILLRHAHAAIAEQCSDLERPLSELGQQEAQAAAAWLHEYGEPPDVVVCSPSCRTTDTLKALQAFWGGNLNVVMDERIYNATTSDLVDILQEHENHERVLLIGHNPGIEQLVALLHSGQTSQYRGVPTAAIAVLHPTADVVLEPAGAKLAAFWCP